MWRDQKEILYLRLVLAQPLWLRYGNAHTGLKSRAVYQVVVAATRLVMAVVHPEALAGGKSQVAAGIRSLSVDFDNWKH